MSPVPPSLAVTTLPPDDQPLTAARGLLASSQAMLARDFDMNIAAGQSVLDRSRYALQTPWDTALADGTGALQAAQASLSNTVNLVLGNALGLADEHGIYVPAPSEVRTRTSYPPPEALQSAPGFGPNPPVVAQPTYLPGDTSPPIEAPGSPATPQPPSAGGGGGGFGWQGECGLLHELAQEFRQYYTLLYYMPSKAYAVFAFGHAPQEAGYKFIYKFKWWWQAELACRLLQECHWSIQKLRPYFSVLDKVQLGDAPNRTVMKAFCGNAQVAFDAYIKATGPH